MIVGNLFALIQNDVKRLVAYICVADVGYNLVAITSVTALGLQANLYFFLNWWNHHSACIHGTRRHKQQGIQKYG